jgi:polyisoprenoid-binding protein YceI
MSKSLWSIDPMHSEIMFRIKHMLITNVSGTFDMFQSIIEADNKDFSDMEISFSADVISINTRNDHRDEHLRSNDFFDAANHPTLTFNSTSLTRIKDNQYALEGNFCIRGIEKNVQLEITHTGIGLDLYGQTKAGFEINGVINRSDFGLSWNAAAEDGGLALGEEISLQISCQFILQ